ncbi:MAG TPA: DUF1573 domain-containing protein [Vicinamibacteria bacterium]|nr:DUF1573 domain-containing protein [Vicinamibacteria bacterium]
MRRRLAAVAVVTLLSVAGGADERPTAAPRIQVEPEGFDFGKAQPGKTLRKEFTIRNFGDAVLVIEGVSTTCGCTAAISAQSRVEPGGRTSLRVTFETRTFSGKVERQVLVRSNDPKTPLLQVRVSATVEPVPRAR